MTRRRSLILAVIVLLVTAGGVALVRGGEDPATPPSPPPPPSGPEATSPEESAERPRRRERKRREGLPKRERSRADRRGGALPPAIEVPSDGTLLAIGDQKPETFADPLFRRIGIRRSRLATPWNSIFTEPDRLDAWLRAARRAGVEPLVAFNLQRGDLCPAEPCRLPSVRDYRRAVRAFRKRYPWVTHLQPWNEANSGTQPTGRNPRRAAEFYNVMRAECPACRIPAADILDSSNMARWLAGFRRHVDGEPKLWGLHNYGDTNRFRDSGTERFLRLVPGEVWLTETGGIVEFTTQSGRRAFPRDEERAAKATRFMFELALANRRRIRRLYIYQWAIDFRGNRFDAGLVRPGGRARPALRVVERYRKLAG